MLTAVPILALILQLTATQAVLGPLTPCSLLVDVVNLGWMPLPGVKVTVRDDRTRTNTIADTNEDGLARFTVTSCADGRCTFTISAELIPFKTVTLKRLWFGASENTIRRVQVRLSSVKGPKITIY